MRYSLIIAATLMTTGAQAQLWRYAPRAAPVPHFAPGRPFGYAAPQFFRQAPAVPLYAPVYRPPAPAFAPRPAPRAILPVAPVMRPVLASQMLTRLSVSC